MSSLIRRAALTVGLATVVVGGLAGLAVWRASAAALCQAYDRALEQRLRSLGNMVRQDVRGNAYLDVNPELMPEFQHGPQCEYYVLAGDRVDGRASPSMPRGAELTSPPLSPEVLTISMIDAPLPDGRSGRIAGMRVTAAPEWDAESVPDPVPPPVTVALATGRSREELDASLDHLAHITLLAVAAEMLIGGVIVVLVMRRLLRALADLATSVTLLDPARTDQRLPPSPEIELAPLVACVNGAADRLTDAYLRERRFASMAAHELRTPVAELRAACEIALRWPDDHEMALRAATEGDRIAQRMGEQVEMLMALTRHRDGLVVTHPQRIDLAVVAQAACRQHLSGAGVPRLDAMLSPTWVLADEAVITALIGNLIANAAAHADTDGWICVRTVSLATGARFEISNPARSLSTADLEHFGEPYWRKDRAHSDRNHAGLGLALCVVLAKASAAELKWWLQDGVLTMSLSMAAARPAD